MIEFWYTTAVLGFSALIGMVLLCVTSDLMTIYRSKNRCKWGKRK